jgi:hypothetical protein
MSTIFLLRAEHFSDPMFVLKAFETKQAAVARAVRLTQTIWVDYERRYVGEVVIAGPVTPENYEARIEHLQGVFGAREVYVVIDELEVQS